MTPAIQEAVARVQAAIAGRSRNNATIESTSKPPINIHIGSYVELDPLDVIAIAESIYDRDAMMSLSKLNSAGVKFTAMENHVRAHFPAGTQTLPACEIAMIHFGSFNADTKRKVNILVVKAEMLIGAVSASQSPPPGHAA